MASSRWLPLGPMLAASGGVDGVPPGPPPPPSAPAGGSPPTGGGGWENVPDWAKWLLFGGGGLALVAVLALVLRGGDGGAGVSSTSAMESSSLPDATSVSLESTTTVPAATTLGPGEAPGEIFLESAAVEGPDSFAAGEVFTTPVPSLPPTTTTSTTGPTVSTSAGQVAVQGRDGDQPGLYGGTLDQASCDRPAMLAFLQADPSKAQAWVDALNSDPDLRWGADRTSLTVADLPAYFLELTPVILLEDSRVTNHGYRDGKPTPRQSVLEAGTAVLVDRYGVPRARCACGNPLIPPQPSPLPPEYVGDPWPGWEPTAVVAVGPSVTIINQIILVDITTGETFIRPTGTQGQEDAPATTTTSTTTTSTTTSTTAPGETLLTPAERANRGRHTYAVEAFEQGCELSPPTPEQVRTITFAAGMVEISNVNSPGSETYARVDQNAYQRFNSADRPIRVVFSRSGYRLEVYEPGDDPASTAACGYFEFTLLD